VKSHPAYINFLSTLILIAITLSLYTLLYIFTTPTLVSNVEGLASIYDKLIYSSKAKVSLIKYTLDNGYCYLYLQNYGKQPIKIKYLIVNGEKIGNFELRDINNHTVDILSPGKIYSINFYYPYNIHSIYILTDKHVFIKLMEVR